MGPPPLTWVASLAQFRNIGQDARTRAGYSLVMELVWDDPALGRSPGPRRAEETDAIHAVDARVWRYQDRSDEPRTSLKWMARGRASYSVGRQRHTLEGDRLLMLAPCHPYEVTVDEPGGAESFCLFIPHAVAASMWAAVTRPCAELLAAPDEGEVPEFPDVVVGGWGELLSRLRALRAALRTGTASPESAQLLFLDALRSIRSLRDGGARLPALKSTTRAELVRRLQRARDYIDARLPEVRPLREIARVACLSPFHLQRCFAIAFGESPAVYASRRRLEQAAHLIATTRRPLVEIAADVGFSSQTAFTRSFRRWRGVSPGACRAATRGRR